MFVTGFMPCFVNAPEISILEAIMLVCWGMSWPVSIIKTLRTKKVNGKSPVFISLIAIGYVSAILHKLLYSCDYLVVLYLFNLSMILIDLYLYTRYNLRGYEDLQHTSMGKTATDKMSVAPIASAEISYGH